MSILKIKDSQGNWIGVPTVKGDTGNGISSAVLNDDYTLTLTFTDGTTYTTPSIRGEKGQTGDTPTITASKTGETTSIYVDGSEVAQVEDGTDGTDGDDGYSPTANVSKIGKTATITITDKNGTTSAQVEDGTDGTDGVSPTVTITPITGGHRITITDKDGEHSADVMDGTGSVEDVQINGTSIVENGVANVPIAVPNTNTFGVVKVKGANGISINNSQELTINPANLNAIKAGTSTTYPITVSHQHESVFFGLAKSAGDTTQSQSSNAVGNYTDTAKGKICNMLDVNRKMRLLKTIEVTEAVASVGFELDENGLPFAVDEVDIVAFIPKTSAPNTLSFAIEEVSTHRQSSKWVAQLSGITSESADTFIRMKIKRSAIRWETITTVAYGTYNGVYTGAIAVKDAITFMAFNGASWVRNNNPLYTTKLSLCINNSVLPVGSIFEFYAHDYQE